MRVCIVEGCDAKHESRGYCKRHNKQMRVYGRVTNSGSIMPKTPNEFTVDGDIVYIRLHDRNGNHTGDAIIDAHRLYLCQGMKWVLDVGGYVAHHGKIYLHSYLMGKAPDKLVIDHINRNKLDNRLENLRYATKSQNALNV